MNRNRRQSLLKRQQGTVKIFDACYATDEPTYFTGTSLSNNISQQSLSSQSSSNEEEASLSDVDTSPDVSNGVVPNVIFTPNSSGLRGKVNGKFHIITRIRLRCINFILEFVETSYFCYYLNVFLYLFQIMLLRNMK